MKKISVILKSILVLATASFLNGNVHGAVQVTIDQTNQSVLVTGGENAIKLQPWSPGTIQVEAAPGQTIPEKKSLVVIATPSSAGWQATESADNVQLKGPRLSAVVDKQTGLVTFSDAGGKLLFAQSAWTFSPAQNPSRDGLNISASFQRSPGEHFYGGGVISDLSKPTADVTLMNNNTQIRIPILYSSRGYGFFWDNTSRGRLSLTQDSVNWSSTAGDLADFYVMAGPTADAAVAEYRNLTGAAPLFPKWAYGFWFSKNKFDNQKQILDAAQDFRTNQFPVDVIVQDYFYWLPDFSNPPSTNWGSHEFIKARYPDPKGMIDTLHNQDHFHFMTVIWAKFDPTTAHAKELQAANALFPPSSDWAGSTLQYYDPFNPKAREIYGRQVMDSLLSLGLDVFWMDGAEPEINIDRIVALNTSVGPMSRVMDAFPLMHTTSVYTAERAVTSDKRVVLLPRSSWAGEQRNAAANWTGDIKQDWKTLAWQIEGLQNYSIAGLPYITTDVGGYEPDPVSESDKELFLRWFQWGTFCPIYRVHGIARPFPWQYGPDMEAIMKKFDLLRYRLLPYIYSEAGRITHENGTIMRPLVMDFQDDSKALDAWDEFLFGPSLLVCPVYKNHGESVATLDQWADQDGKPGGVTASFLRSDDATGSGSRLELQDMGTGFRFKNDLTDNQKGAKIVRVEGTYTPKQDGKFELTLATSDAPKTITVEGQPVNPDVPAGDLVFAEFPLDGKAGTPIHFSFDSNDKRPGFRVLSVLPGPQHRDVYLPGKDDWYDFWTGQRLTSAQTLSVETPLERIPLYVRAGSIVPMGPELQYADEKAADPIELRVYRGANGSYTLYEDSGDSYNYEKGAFANIPITWNETSQTLTIGDRKGSFPEMLAKHTFQVVWVSQGHGAGEEVTEKADSEVSYEGTAVTVKAPVQNTKN